MKNIKVTLEYDGTGYHGWQIQPNAKTVQGTLEEAIEKLLNEKVDLIGASRTDEGVHAYGQVANFTTNSSIPAEKMALAINTMLPDDIVVVKSELVDEQFHSRYDTKGKKYKYLIYNRRSKSALMRNRAYYVPQKLNLESIIDASKVLIGTHDFSSFKATGGSAKTSVRTVYDISIKQKEDLISIEISGDGFLYNMVRIIAGTLVEFGIKSKKKDEMVKILEGKDRKLSGKTAPSKGLYLMEVFY